MQKLDPLSYSSATLLQNCSKKYYLYKIKKVPKDPDSEEDNGAFNIGKAFHKVLEVCRHKRQPIKDFLDETCIEYDVVKDKPRIHAMLLKYFDLHEKSKLEVVSVEFPIVTDSFIGYIDALLKAEDGRWYICDLKTTSRLDESLKSKLKNDLQLNLYSSFKDAIATQFNLDKDKFTGCLYRATTKSALRYSEKNSYEEEVARFYKSVESYEIEVPVHLLNPKEAIDKHRHLYFMAMGLNEGTVEPFANYNYCTSYFRPCEYWSHCHGKPYSECQDELKIKSSENYDSV